MSRERRFLVATLYGLAGLWALAPLAAPHLLVALLLAVDAGACAVLASAVSEHRRWAENGAVALLLGNLGLVAVDEIGVIDVLVLAVLAVTLVVSIRLPVARGPVAASA